MWDESLIDAAPVTGSLVSSALLDCLDVYCTAGFTSYWTFCSTDCVLLAGFVLFLRRVSECRMRGLASRLVSSYTFRGMLRKRWWIFRQKMSYP